MFWGFLCFQKEFLEFSYHGSIWNPDGEYWARKVGLDLGLFEKFQTFTILFFRVLVGPEWSHTPGLLWTCWWPIPVLSGQLTPMLTTGNIRYGVKHMSYPQNLNNWKKSTLSGERAGWVGGQIKCWLCHPGRRLQHWSKRQRNILQEP